MTATVASTVATTAIPLLDTTDQIDAGWVQAMLADGFPGVVVRGVERRPIGAGNVSDTVLVSIDYDNRPEGAPDAVVAKFRPAAPEVHAHGLASGAYHREIGAYRTISEQSACRIPGLFHVAGDETNINLVVEDLSGATPGNQVAGCGLAEATAVVTEQAKLHATYFPLDPATAPAWPIRLADVADYWTDLATRGGAIAAERYRDRLSPENLAAIADMVAVAHQWHLLPHGRLSLTHGDPRVDNVLFEQTDEGVGAVLIDWQVTGIRNPLYDVGYFLSGSVSVDDRRAHEHALLEHYVATFETIRPGAYTVEQATADFRTQVMSGLLITTAAIAVLPDVEAVNTLILALLERNCAAALDWDAVGATRAQTA